MIPFLVFMFWLAALTLEGALLTSLILRSKLMSSLTLSLALPLGALCNAVILFVCTLFSVPLLFWTMVVGHGVVIACMWAMRRKMILKDSETSEPDVSTSAHHPSFSIINFQFSIIRVICITLLTVQTFFSFTHAVILPTYHIDSLTNWTMRSKVSFYDHAIAFDATEVRGVAKPQYPILFHALQIIVNEGNADWNDRTANAIHFFLTLSAFLAIFFLLQKKRGTDVALIGITMLTSIPLLAFHLSQGYGDLPLVLFLCLSFVSLWIGRSEGDRRWLFLSALFVAASVWTKSEGLFIGLAPWLLMVLIDARKKANRITHSAPLIAGVLLSLPFPVFLLMNGMGLTPHASDSRIEWHPEVLGSIASGLFASGSMGIVWIVLALASALFLWLAFKSDERIDRSGFLLGLWGLLSLLIILATYIFTPNAVFLANGESYYRQLMIPAALLLLWICLLPRKQPSV